MTWTGIHKWLSLVLGVFLFIICFTGALLSFERELTEFFAPDTTGGLPFFDVVRSLHGSLALGAVGSFIVGFSVLAFVFILISGVVMWGRIASHGFWRSLSLFFPTPLRGMHVALGVYFLIVLLLCSLTGLTWSFGWFHDIVYFLFDGMTEAPLGRTIGGLHTGRILGTTGRILWCVGSLVGASLPLTGYWIFARRIRIKSHKHA